MGSWQHGHAKRACCAGVLLGGLGQTQLWCALKGGKDQAATADLQEQAEQGAAQAQQASLLHFLDSLTHHRAGAADAANGCSLSSRCPKLRGRHEAVTASAGVWIEVELLHLTSATAKHAHCQTSQLPWQCPGITGPCGVLTARRLPSIPHAAVCVEAPMPSTCRNSPLP